MEKRVAGLMEESKHKKYSYIAEIKKLTDIINMSEKDVRVIVLENTKEAMATYGCEDGRKRN